MSELSLGVDYRDPVVVTPAPYGLLSPAATVIVDEDPHWVMGLSHGVSDFAKVSVIYGEGAGARRVVVHEGDDSTYREAVPFVVEVEFTASAMGTAAEEVRDVVEMYLEAATQKAVEREFWTGGLREGMENAHYLASSDAEVVNPAVGSPVKTKYGLALLEQALGDDSIGGRGVIHATRGVASALGFKGGSNGRIETPIGNYLVAGSGYTGTGPDGEEPTGDQAWMYATGPVVVRLGPADMYQEREKISLDIRNNTIHYKGLRAAAAYWTNNSHFAVLVDLAQDYS